MKVLRCERTANKILF